MTEKPGRRLGIASIVCGAAGVVLPLALLWLAFDVFTDGLAECLASLALALALGLPLAGLVLGIQAIRRGSRAYGCIGIAIPAIALIISMLTPAGRDVMIFLVSGYGEVDGRPSFRVHRPIRTAPRIGMKEIAQLREHMIPAQVHAILRKPESRRTGPGTVREAKVDRVEKGAYFEYYRKGTLMLVYDKDDRLIEVAIGETSQEYYDRKDGKKKALWEHYPEEGFIHQDVWRPGTALDRAPKRTGSYMPIRKDKPEEDDSR